MSNTNNFYMYIQPSYSAVTPVDTNDQEDLSIELIVFLHHYPDLLKSETHLQCLCYCFDHYINVDPSSRNLPIQEKFKQAGEMAINFLGKFMESKF